MVQILRKLFAREAGTVHMQQALSLPSPYLYYIRQSAMLQKRSRITVHCGATVVQELTNQIGQVSL